VKLPEHKASLTIVHNEHKDYYISAEDWIYNDSDFLEWESEEKKLEAMNTDSIWVIQWYPETPNGFHAIAAPTLEEAVSFANSF
jgi:hypothetical protein